VTEYLFPASVEEALAQLGQYGGRARIIAGGTDVMPDIRRGKISPRCLVDVTRIPGLDQIQVTEDFVVVGAAVTFAAIKESPFLNQHVHALADAARSVGAVAIQNAATWAGNVVQAMPAADGAIVAIALEAQARVVDAGGATWRSIESLFLGPGVSAVDPSRQLITHIRFPRPHSPWGTAWNRVGRRPALVLPILNCAVSLCLDPGSGRITHACIALGPVAPRPFRAREAEAFLKGQPPGAEPFAQAARMVQGGSNPRSSVMRASREYRLAVIPSLVSDGLAVAAERASSREPC
jgi:CO/xanthine dehydrogenase FAD-binding subunit